MQNEIAVRHIKLWIIYYHVINGSFIFAMFPLACKGEIIRKRGASLVAQY